MLLVNKRVYHKTQEPTFIDDEKQQTINKWAQFFFFFFSVFTSVGMQYACLMEFTELKNRSINMSHILYYLDVGESYVN